MLKKLTKNIIKKLIFMAKILRFAEKKLVKIYISDILDNLI